MYLPQANLRNKGRAVKRRGFGFIVDSQSTGLLSILSHSAIAFSPLGVLGRIVDIPKGLYSSVFFAAQ